MVTTGRRLLIAAVGVALAGTFGCSSTPRTSEATAGSPTPNSAASSQPSGSLPAADSGKPFCKVDTPDAWKRAQTAGALQAAPGESLDPMAVSPDGSSVIAASRHDGRVALVWVRDQGRERTTVYTAANAGQGGLGLADFDGRWLVFSVLASNDVGSKWELLAWDSRAGGEPRSIARTQVGADGNAVPGPFLYPWVNNGKATWVQGFSDGSKDQKLADVQRQVHLYDLASGSDRIVHTGRMAPSFFAGDTLVWPEAFAIDTPTKLTGVTEQGAPSSLPEALAAADGSPASASDGTTWAWTGAGNKNLYAWRAGWPAPVTVVEGDAIDWVHVAGDVITWTDPTATWAADLRGRAYTQITPKYGGTNSHGSAVVVSYPGPDKRSVSYVFTSGGLAPLSCS
ncbi:hypothetical protein ABZW10_20950 [Kitasatospora sp. NPDC004723]|uniref:hypothetical protein n=1 Tax=Kitasatospora sp. NPDC004723 TaxID=3154288 RepID=UPI0033AA3B0B